MISSVQTVVFTLISALTTVKSWSNAQADPEEQAENTRKYRRAMRILRGLQCKKRNNKVILFHTVQRDKHEGADI